MYEAFEEGCLALSFSTAHVSSNLLAALRAIVNERNGGPGGCKLLKKTRKIVETCESRPKTGETPDETVKLAGCFEASNRMDNCVAQEQYPWPATTSLLQ